MRWDLAAGFQLRIDPDHANQGWQHSVIHHGGRLSCENMNVVFSSPLFNSVEQFEVLVNKLLAGLLFFADSGVMLLVGLRLRHELV